MDIADWLFLPEVWIIAGILLIVAEVLDGGMIFFLPFGIASLLNAGLISQQGSFELPNILTLSTWSDTLISQAVFAVVAVLVLRVVSRLRGKRNEPDVNEY